MGSNPLWLLFVCSTIALTGCPRDGMTDANIHSYAYVPDTTDKPQLTLKWDGPLDETTVKHLGPFGIKEGGGGFEEIATEYELHLNKGGDPIYALADGIVVYLQPPLSGAVPGEVEGVWVRYGRNFIIKYVHLLNPLVKEGQTIKAGERIGTVATYNQEGFWEVEVQVKEGNHIYAYPWLNFCDATSRATLEGLWANSQISRSETKSPWTDLDRYDVTERTRPGVF